MFVARRRGELRVGLCRLELDATLIGRLSSDPLGRFASAALEGEGVDLSKCEKTTDLRDSTYASGSPTACVVPLLPARLAGSRFGADDWPANLDEVDWLHVTGITAALSETCRAGLELPSSGRRSARCGSRSIRITGASSGHPRRPALAARNPRSCHTLLLGTSEGELLFGTDDPRSIGEQAGSWGVQEVAIKRGDRGRALGAAARCGTKSLRSPGRRPVGPATPSMRASCVPDQRWIAAGGTRPRNYCGAKVAELPVNMGASPDWRSFPPTLLARSQLRANLQSRDRESRERSQDLLTNLQTQPFRETPPLRRSSPRPKF